jgi:hypothetical protein
MAMPTHTITADQITDGLYTGSVDVTDYAGHIVIAENLGTVRFSGHVRTKGRMEAGAGSGISAGDGISAGSGISAGDGISAGYGISAGDGISAGSGISAGYGIKAKWVDVAIRIFVGLCLWREPEGEERQLRAELRRGVLAFGEHVPPVVEEATAPVADEIQPLTACEIARVRELIASA